MKNFKYIFPNLLTLINLFLGLLSILIVFRGENEYYAAWLIFLAAFFDLLDGMVARALDARSEFGAQLDSLADMVSFGIAPTFIIFNWLNLVLTNMSTHSTFAIVAAEPWQYLVLSCSLIFALTAAVRLAQFNVKGKELKGFLGLPSPAAGLIIASLWLILGNTEITNVRDLLLNLYFVLAIILTVSALMISKIGMLSFKMTSLGLKENIFQYLLILIGAISIIIMGFEGILLTLLAYIVLSLIHNLFERSKK